MNQRLCIGIQRIDSGWQSILDQIGLWYEEVSYGHSLAEQYSVIILNDKIHASQEKQLKEYLGNGGSLLETGKYQVFTDSKNTLTRRVSTLTNKSQHPAFQHIPFIDIFSKIYLHRESSLFQGLMHIRNAGDGFLGFMGADLPALLNSKGYMRKRFFNPSAKHADEIVSKVSKHELMQAFIALLKELHFLRKIPFLKKWESPAKKPVFSFRVDSDFGDQKSMDDLYKLAQKNNLSLTWFLHVKAHESWLNHFHSYTNQEIALHGYSHGTSLSASKTLENTSKGLNLLQKEGFKTDGFCAPYGIFNRALVKTLEKSRFSYTSEFTFCYDGYPIQTENEKLPLQIPIHPICTGSLKRQELTISEMTTYFEFILINKLARFEPVIFYHHPLQTGLKTMEHLFKRVKSENLVNLTFSQLANFWKQRQNFKFESFWDENQVEITSSSEDKIFIQSCKNHQEFDLIAAGAKKLDLSQPSEFEYAKQYLPEPSQISNMRNHDLQLFKTSMLDWKNRIRL
ncbi:MAG: DUF2334 domain-containing protein [Balneolaceae bacterium]